MDVSSVGTKIARPTLPLAALAILIDITSIKYSGKSPAFMTAEELLKGATTDIIYFSVIFSLCGIFIIIPIAILTIGISAASWLILIHPLKKIRALRTLIRYSRRKTLPRDLVKRFAEQTRDQSLLLKLKEDEQRQAKSIISPIFMLVIVLMLAYLLNISSPSNPNFIMKVCGLRGSAQTCGAYYATLVMIYLQALVLFSIFFQGFRSSMRISKVELHTPPQEILKFHRENPEYSFADAKSKWMRKDRNKGT